MTREDAALSVIADAQQQIALAENELHEVVRVAQRAIVMVDGNKPHLALTAAGVAAGIAAQAARRIEVAAAMRSAANRILEGK